MTHLPLCLFGWTVNRGWFTNEAEQFAFETWLDNSSIFGEIRSHEELSNATLYRCVGAETMLVIMSVAVIILFKCHVKTHSSWFLIIGLILQMVFPIVTFNSNQLHSHLSRLRWYFIGRFVFGLGIALSATYSVTYLYKYSINKPLNVRRRILGSLNTYSMLGEFAGLLLSYLRFLEKMNDVAWLCILNAFMAIIGLITTNIYKKLQENSNQTSNSANEPMESNPKTLSSTVLNNQTSTLVNETMKSSPIIPSSSTVPINGSTKEEQTFSFRDWEFIKALLSSVVLQILVILYRDMWRWNFEDIFKSIKASEEEIDEWILAMTFCSTLFVIASSIYLPHSFEPLKKIRYATSINFFICILALGKKLGNKKINILVANDLKSTQYLGLAAVVHYSFGSLSIEVFNELLPSFFRNKKELEFGFTFTNLCRTGVVHLMVIMHLKEVKDFVTLVIAMSVMQLLMVFLIPLIEKWLEHREHIAHYKDIGDILPKYNCIDEDDKLNIIAPITEIINFDDKMLIMKVNDKTGEIQVDINLELYHVNDEQRKWMREIFNDNKDVKRRILCLRKAMLRNNTITNFSQKPETRSPKSDAFAIFSCKKFIIGKEDHFHLHDNDWALIGKFVSEWSSRFSPTTSDAKVSDANTTSDAKIESVFQPFVQRTNLIAPKEDPRPTSSHNVLNV